MGWTYHLGFRTQVLCLNATTCPCPFPPVRPARQIQIAVPERLWPKRLYLDRTALRNCKTRCLGVCMWMYCALRHNKTADIQSAVPKCFHCTWVFVPLGTLNLHAAAGCCGLMFAPRFACFKGCFRHNSSTCVGSEAHENAVFPTPYHLHCLQAHQNSLHCSHTMNQPLFTVNEST